MYQEFFIQKGVLILPIVAMLSFVLSFAAILLWSLRAEQKPHYNGLAQLPIDSDPTASAAVATPERGEKP